MPPIHYTVFLILLAINLLAYALMWKDKRAAIHKKRRTPERTFHIISFLFGALGIWLGSRSPLYHKRAKVGFMRWTYLFLFLNLLLLVLGYWIVN